MFSQAQLLIGAEGAGFTNMIFMPEMAQVLLLDTPGTPHVFLAQMAAHNFIGYHHFTFLHQDAVCARDIALALPHEQHVGIVHVSEVSFAFQKSDTSIWHYYHHECAYRVDIERFMPFFEIAFSAAFSYLEQSVHR